MEMRQLSFEHSAVTLAFQKHNTALPAQPGLVLGGMLPSASLWVESYWSQHENTLVCSVHMTTAISSANHSWRVTEYLRLESTSGDCLVQPTAQSSVSQSRLPTTAGGPVTVWISPRLETSPPLWETCSTVWSPLKTKCFLVFKWIFLYFGLCLLLLVHSLNATKKRLVPFSFEQVLKPPAVLVTLHWTCSSLTKPVLL